MHIPDNGAGIPADWLEGVGVSVKGLRTPQGALAYTLKAQGDLLRLDVPAEARLTLDLAPGADRLAARLQAREPPGGLLATTRSNRSSTQARAPSVARKVMVIWPASPSTGVPEKVRLAGSKRSQAGRPEAL